MAASWQKPHVRERLGSLESLDPLLDLLGPDHAVPFPQFPLVSVCLREVCIVEVHLQRNQPPCKVFTNLVNGSTPRGQRTPRQADPKRGNRTPRRLRTTQLQLRRQHPGELYKPVNPSRSLSPASRSPHSSRQP